MHARSVPAALALALALAACSSQGPAKPAGSAAADALYERGLAAVERHKTGRAQLASGEDRSGREAMAQAAADLSQAAAECLALAACDGNRFVSMYDALVRPDTAQDEVDSPDETLAGEGPEQAPPRLVDLPEAARSVNLLNGRELRDVIALNGPVKAALSEWLTSLRPNLVTAWEQYQYLRYLMWPEYEAAGLPEALLFGILAKESGGRVHAVSRSGASGPLQFMYSTGLRYGLGRVDGFDTRFDPRLSARANVLYLNDRFAELNHNLELALAAYNGGEGRVARAYRRGGGKGFWDPQVYAQMPPETRDYVPMVLAAAWLFLHPADYGLEFPQVDATSSSVRLVKPISMNELGICIGDAGRRDGWFRVLRNLNPRYEAHTRIPAGTELRMPAAILPVYRAQCVEGPRAELAAELVAARAPARTLATSVRSYVVRKGDTLAAIARRNRCGSPQALARENGIRPPAYLIRPGQRLRLTGCRL